MPRVNREIYVYIIDLVLTRFTLSIRMKKIKNKQIRVKRKGKKKIVDSSTVKNCQLSYATSPSSHQK